MTSTQIHAEESTEPLTVAATTRRSSVRTTPTRRRIAVVLLALVATLVPLGVATASPASAASHVHGCFNYKPLQYQYGYGHLSAHLGHYNATGPYANMNVDLYFWVPGYGWYHGLSTTTNSSGCYSFPQLSYGTLSTYHVQAVARSTKSNLQVSGASGIATPGWGSVSLGTAEVSYWN